MKHTFEFHLYQFQSKHMGKPVWHLASGDGWADDDPEWLYVGPRPVKVEVPNFQDMREHQIAALRQQEKKLRAEFAKNVTDIQARIQSLLAIEMAA